MDLPSGTVTFLFSDVEGSTQLLERHPDAMGAALARHHELFEELVPAHHGAIFETIGDAVYAAFSRATDAVQVALGIQRKLAEEDWGPIGRLACRLALHTGEVERRGDHYFGPALFRCARLQALGYGEQTLLSRMTADLVRDWLPKGASLRDMGTHRLKDLGEPEHVFALTHPDLRETFPPLKSLDRHPNNLPLQLSSFVGRERELRELADVVRAHRLVTVTGTGGIGKTRVALQLAAQLLGDTAEAAFFVDMAPLRQASQIAGAAAAAIGLTPVPGATPESALAGYLGTQNALIVLDNAEQIPQGGNAVLGLLERSPKLRILVTSRGPLHVRGEQVYPVEPLTTAMGLGDGAADPMTPPALLLFAERAAEVRPAFALTAATRPTVAAIAERLDGLPLAIELAAARMALFEPSALLARLDQSLSVLTGGPADLPERQQALRATIDWSYQLLDRADRAAFSRLAVFSGGWSLDAGEFVAGAGADTLLRLVNAALVRRQGERFGMLETIREYAAQKNAARSDGAASRRQHAEWFRDWVAELVREAGTRDLRSVEQMRVLGAERANLHAALNYLLDSGDGESALQMAVPLWMFWLRRGEARQAEAWLSSALELAPNADSPPLGWALVVQSELARFQGEVASLIPLKERAVELSLRGNDRRTAAAALHDLAGLWCELGELDKAEAAAREAVSLRREIGLPAGIAHALDALASVELTRGNLLAARELYEETLAEARRSEDRGTVMFALADAAEVERRLGEPRAAAKGFVEAITMAGDWESTEFDPEALLGVAELLTDCGQPGRAAELLGAASAIRQRYGMQAGTALYNGARERAQGLMAAFDFAAAWERGEAMSRIEALRQATEASAELASGPQDLSDQRIPR